MKKKKSSGGGANWMDTYGDMVTLLLCFFVLLYSISTVTEEKWMALVQSFNPDAVSDIKATPGGEGPNADGDETPTTQAGIDATMTDLYEQLKAYVESSGSANNISVTKGQGYVFVSFNQAVFFTGDSWTLLEDSKPVLDTVADMLNSAADAIDEVQILGHTAQQEPNKPNPVEADRMIASNRATMVTIYLQNKTAGHLEPGRLVSVSYGQHRPVGDNSTEEGRAQNRRVEMIIAGKDIANALGDSLEQYQTMREGDSAPAPSAGNVRTDE